MEQGIMVALRILHFPDTGFLLESESFYEEVGKQKSNIKNGL